MRHSLEHVDRVPEHELPEMISARKKTVLIADDHPLLAEGLAGLLSQDYEVVGLAASGRQLLAEATRLKPDLITLDVSMPDLNGIEAARQLRKNGCLAKLVFVTQQIDPQYLRAAFQAGALGYVAKQSASDELKVALRSALSGKSYISPMLQELIGYVPVAELRDGGASSGANLTARQREVLQLVAEGKTIRDIAAALTISAKTVEFHKKAIMDQTGLRTTAELTRYAITHGIVQI
jgi:DNA-binding NarL/FixJ family response regulator